MKTFPIMLDLKGKTAVVVGAGPVGLRRVRTLLDAGAKVRLVDKKPLECFCTQVTVDVVVKEYDSSLLQGAALVLACTDDRELNSRIAQDARRLGAWVNVADQPEDCDFFMPSVAADGPVVLAVGTSGQSPALAAAMREKLQAHMPKQIGDFTELLGRIRTELKLAVHDDSRRKRILTALAGDDVYREFIDKGEQAVRLRLARLLQ